MNWYTGNNNFYNNGQPLTYEADIPNPTTETGSTYGDPHLTLSGTPTTWQGWVNYYRPLWDSQSNAMLLGQGHERGGHDPAAGRDRGYRGQPAAAETAAMTSALMNTRAPRSPRWRTSPVPTKAPIGDNSGAFLRPPSTSLTSPAAGLLPGPGPLGMAGLPPCRIPSHTYTAKGTYTVALTATNSAGNNTCTKTNYITVKPLNAAFTRVSDHGQCDPGGELHRPVLQ